MSVLPAASAGPVDAVAILTADHESIKKKFRQFRSMCLRGETADAQKVARRICRQELMAQIIGSSIADDRYAARVGMLAEYVNHHIREEQEELFPQARRCGLDMDEIGSRMLARRLDLEAGAVAVDDAPTRRGSGRQDGGRRTAGHG